MTYQPESHHSNNILNSVAFQLTNNVFNDNLMDLNKKIDQHRSKIEALQIQNDEFTILMEQMQEQGQTIEALKLRSTVSGLTEQINHEEAAVKKLQEQINQLKHDMYNKKVF